jgi:hypothetical protein
VRDEQKRAESKLGKVKANALQKESNAMECYLRYHKLSTMVRHSHAMAQTLEKDSNRSPKDLVRAYDTLVQHVRSMKEQLSHSGIPETSIEMKGAVSGIDATKLTFESFRMFFAAAEHEVMEKDAEAVALYRGAAGRAARAKAFHTERVRELQDEETAAEVSAYIRRLDMLLQKCRAMACSVSARATLRKYRGKEESKGEFLPTATKRELLQRIRDYDAGFAEDNFNLIRIPPTPQPIPCKPLVFDTAWSCLDMPDFDELEEVQGQQGKGFLSRFF